MRNWSWAWQAFMACTERHAQVFMACAGVQGMPKAIVCNCSWHGAYMTTSDICACKWFMQVAFSVEKASGAMRLSAE
jgi:hypothetical protein